MFECPCCNKMTLTEEPGHYDVCSECSWEDDPIQRDDPGYEGGANKMSLNQAREAYKHGEKVI